MFDGFYTFAKQGCAIPPDHSKYNMKDYEKAIEDAANRSANEYYSPERKIVIREQFIIGAKSPEAKEFHQQRMYSEEEVKLLCSRAQMKYAFASVSDQPYSVDEFDKNFNYWFNQNKKK